VNDVGFAESVRGCGPGYTRPEAEFSEDELLAAFWCEAGRWVLTGVDAVAALRVAMEIGFLPPASSPCVATSAEPPDELVSATLLDTVPVLNDAELPADCCSLLDGPEPGSAAGVAAGVSAAAGSPAGTESSPAGASVAGSCVVWVVVVGSVAGEDGSFVLVPLPVSGSV
jgi:hypothetical protein